MYALYIHTPCKVSCPAASVKSTKWASCPSLQTDNLVYAKLEILDQCLFMGRSTAPTKFLHSLIPSWLCPGLSWFH